MTKHFFLGIDPGARGGIALVDEEGKYQLAVKMPEDEDELSTTIKGFVAIRDKLHVPVTAFLEKLITKPLWRTNKRTGAREQLTHQFGIMQQNYGLIRGILVAHGIQREYVTASSWQNALSCGKKGAAPAQHKRNLKEKALKMFPGGYVTLQTCDALLIAEYGRRKTLKEQEEAKRKVTLRME